jgi:hypothetical protein
MTREDSAVEDILGKAVESISEKKECPERVNRFETTAVRN